MYIHTLGNIDDKLDVGIIIVVGAPRYLVKSSQPPIDLEQRQTTSEMLWPTYLHVLVCHAYVVGIGLQILRGSHDRKLNGPFISERLVGPFSDRPDLFDCRDTVVCNQNLERSCQPVI